jgi:hypothetical protein
MKKGWLTTACGVRVEHLPCPRPGSNVDETRPAAGVIHTIEGSLASGLTVFQRHFAPTFAVGGHRIVQLVPLGATAASLDHVGNPPTNQWARVQIEVEGRSSEKPYRFDPVTESTVAHLLAALAILDIVPLHRPFVDAMPPGPWAVPSFTRRLAGKWGHEAGWYGHVEIPENSHWDPGALEWTKLLQRATAIRAVYVQHQPPKKVPRPKAVPAALRHRLRPGGRAVIPTPCPS